MSAVPGGRPPTQLPPSLKFVAVLPHVGSVKVGNFFVWPVFGVGVGLGFAVAEGDGFTVGDGEGLTVAVGDGFGVAEGVGEGFGAAKAEERRRTEVTRQRTAGRRSEDEG